MQKLIENVYASLRHDPLWETKAFRPTKRDYYHPLRAGSPYWKCADRLSNYYPRGDGICSQVIDLVELDLVARDHHSPIHY